MNISIIPIHHEYTIFFIPYNHLFKDNNKLHSIISIYFNDTFHFCSCFKSGCVERSNEFAPRILFNESQRTQLVPDQQNKRESLVAILVVRQVVEKTVCLCLSIRIFYKYCRWITMWSVIETVVRNFIERILKRSLFMMKTFCSIDFQQ